MYRFFKCNVLGGFRLSDLNKSIKQGECFYIDSSFCDTSRAVRAALQAKWMTEITEKEASQFVSIPRNINAGGVQQTEVGRKPVSANRVAIPNVAETNENLESRQAKRNFKKQATQKQKEEDKPIMPNFNEAEKTMKLRQADITTKGPDEVLQSPVEAKKEAQVEKKEQTQQTVKDLSKEIAENEMLATPNFDEKKEAIKAEVSGEIEKKVRRRRRTTETTEVV